VSAAEIKDLSIIMETFQLDLVDGGAHAADAAIASLRALESLTGVDMSPAINAVLFTHGRPSLSEERFRRFTDALNRASSEPSSYVPPQQYVYFIRRPDGQIKIGFSHEPESRLRAISSQSGLRMMLLATIPGGAALERELHARFDEYREIGEWFRPCRDIDAFIESISKGAN